MASPSAPRSSVLLRIDWLASFAVSAREIDLGGAVEDQPERIGAAEHRGRRRHGEGKFQAQRVAGAMRGDDDRRIRIGRRRLGHGRGSRRRVTSRRRARLWALPGLPAPRPQARRLRPARDATTAWHRRGRRNRRRGRMRAAATLRALAPRPSTSASTARAAFSAGTVCGASIFGEAMAAFGSAGGDGALIFSAVGLRPRRSASWRPAARSACSPVSPMSTTMLRSSRNLPHLGRAVEREADLAGIEIEHGFDRLQRRRQRGVGLAQIPFDRLVEGQRQRAVARVPAPR